MSGVNDNMLDMQSIHKLALRIAMVIAGLAGMIAILGALVLYVPGFASVIAAALVCAFLLLAIASAVVGVTLSVEIPPLQPIAEVSILGKHAFGFGKLSFALLAFFGNTALTWVIALSVATQGEAQQLPQIAAQLWQLFGMLAGLIAYAFWLWIAIDLSRAGRVRRLEAVNAIVERAFQNLQTPRIRGAILQSARWIAGGPWWQMILSFYIAPLLAIALIGPVLST